MAAFAALVLAAALQAGVWCGSAAAQSQGRNFWDLSEESPQTSPPVPSSPPQDTAPQEAAPRPQAKAPSADTTPGRGEAAAAPRVDLRRAGLSRLLRLGERARKKGRPAQAAVYFEEVLRRAPYHFQANLSLGRVYRSRAPAKAEAYLLRARRLNPNDDSVHYLLGQVRERLERPMDAAESYRRAIYLNPRHYSANQRLRKLLRRLRSEKTVVDRAADSFYANPSLATLTLFGRIVMRHAEPRAAVMEFEEVRRRQPNLAEANLWLARAHHAAGDPPGEMEAYRRYLKRQPEADGVRLLLVERLTGQGWYRQAELVMAPFGLRDGNVPERLTGDTRGRLFFLRSRLLSARQQPAGAAAALARAALLGYRPRDVEAAYAEDLALFPDSAELWEGFGRWLIHHGKPGEGAAALGEAALLSPPRREPVRQTLASLTDGPASAAALLALSELDLAEDNPAGALEHLRRIPPGHALGHRADLLRGKIHRRQGNMDAALDAFVRYIFFFKDPLDVLYARGNLFWELGQREEALAIWQENPDVLARHPQLLTQVVELYHQRGDETRELATRQRLAQALPKHLENRIRLGELLLARQRPGEALAQWEAALLHRPLHRPLILRIAGALLAMEDEEKAVAYLQRAAEMKPLDQESSALVARHLFSKRRYGEALDRYWDLYAKYPQHPDLPRVLPELVVNIPAPMEAMQVAARLALDTGREEAAIEVLEAIITADGMQRQARVTLAELYLKRERPQDAERTLVSPFTAASPTLEELVLLAQAQERAGRPEALEGTLARIERLRPGDMSLVRRRGLLLFRIKRPDQAQPQLARYLQHDPADREVLYALARSEAALGHTAMEEARLEELLALEPEHRTALKRVIALKIKGGRWNKLTPYLERWVRRYPKDSKSRYNLVVAYLKQFQKEQARPHFERLREDDPRRARPLASYFQ